MESLQNQRQNKFSKKLKHWGFVIFDKNYCNLLFFLLVFFQYFYFFTEAPPIAQVVQTHVLALIVESMENVFLEHVYALKLQEKLVIQNVSLQDYLEVFF